MQQATQETMSTPMSRVLTDPDLVILILKRLNKKDIVKVLGVSNTFLSLGVQRLYRTLEYSLLGKLESSRLSQVCFNSDIPM